MRAPFPWVIALLSLELSLNAQTWEGLRGLKPRDLIKVQAAGGTQYSGKFQSVSADAISLETSRGAVSVDRIRVRRVQVRSTGRRIRRLVIAAGIGLAIGATLDQTLGAYFRNETGEPAGSRALIYLAPTAVFGVIAGAFPAYRTAYRSR